MKNKILVLLGAGVMVIMLAAAGCSAAVTASDNEKPINVNVNNQQGLWVTGTGKVPVAPNLATLNLGVEVEKPSVSEAQAAASESMNKVMQVLTDKGILKADIQTRNFNIYQVTRWDDSKQQNKPTGYNVSNMVSVKVRDLLSLSGVVDSVVSAGGDNIRFHGINFSVEKPEQYYIQAREHAMQDARANAEKLAALSGTTLGKVTYLVENLGNNYGYYNYANSGIRQEAAYNALDTAISIGQNEIVVTVTVVYEIQ